MYAKIRPNLYTGDIIAFGGRSWWSWIIKFFTRSVVSHIGIIACVHRSNGLTRIQLVESTVLDGFAGVTVNRLSSRIEQYRGNIWWLPINRDRVSVGFDTCKFSGFIADQTGKKYDSAGAVRAGIDWLDWIPGLRRLTRNRENFRRLYCSELAAGALQAASVLPEQINCSEITPDDLCRLKIYKPQYVQLRGKPQNISGYNSIILEDYYG